LTLLSQSVVITDGSGGAGGASGPWRCRKQWGSRTGWRAVHRTPYAWRRRGHFLCRSRRGWLADAHLGATPESARDSADYL